MSRLSCAFTGHRPKFFPWGYNEVDPRCVELKVAFSNQISLLVNEGYTDFLCGMALGVDYEKRKVMRSEVLEAA